MASDHQNPDQLGTLRGLSSGQKVFNRFTLKQKLGQGGMGVVWLASDEKLGLDIALKFVPEAVSMDHYTIEEMKRETRSSLKLTHPNIVRIYDFFDDPTRAAISMEFVNGRTLRQMSMEKEQRVFRMEELEPWVGRLCEALDYAHLEAKVVHRDIKPANLMVTVDGELKITDFGIARSLSDSITRVTTTTGTSGTLVYMSPQQLEGLISKPTDDIYSVGVTLYELLTSKPPFYTGDITHQIRYIQPAFINQRLEELRIHGPVSKVVEEAVAACLAKDPSDRPQSARELLERLGCSHLERSRSQQARPQPNKSLEKTRFEPAKIRPLASTSGIIRRLNIIVGLVTLPFQRLLQRNQKSGDSSKNLSNTPQLPPTEAPDVTLLGMKVAPPGFFDSQVFPGTKLAAQSKTAAYVTIEQSFIFYRARLDQEYANLLDQVRDTYKLWRYFVIVAFVVLISGVVAAFMGYVEKGIITTISLIPMFFILRVFNQREDHYRILASAMSAHLEYGNHWLLVMHSIKAVQDPTMKRERQARLVEVLMEKLGTGKGKPHRVGAVSPSNEQKKLH